MRTAVRFVLLLVCVTFVLTANAWRCYECQNSRDWSDKDKFCGNCGAQKPQPRPIPRETTPPPYTPPYTPPPRPTPSYSPSRTTSTGSDHWTPLKLTIAGPVGIPSGYFNNVYGIEVGALWNKSDRVYGLQACGICNIADEMHGLQIGGVNVADRGSVLQAGVVNHSDYFAGLQIGGLANSVGKEMYGVRVGLVNGVQSGGVMHGLDIGYMNVGDGVMSGVQLGLGNKFDGHVNGLQIGYINYANELTGVQLGVFNIIDKSPVPFFPLINACF